MNRNSKFSLKQKLLAVRSIISGKESALSAGLKIGAHKETVRLWAKHYQATGISGLKLRNGSYTSTFKLQVVKHVLKNKLSLVEAAVLFEIPKGYTILQWLKKYESCGEVGLLKQNRGRKKLLMAKKPDNSTKQRKKPGTFTESQLAALQAENEYLRAENALLKKLDALIQEEKAAKLQNKQQRPSKD